MADDDKQARVEMLARAIIFGYTVGAPQYSIPVEVARAVAEVMDDCGVRQTDEKSTEIELPGWLSEKVREETTPIPEPVDQHSPRETDLVGEAPEPPKRIAAKYMGVVTSGT